MEVSGQPPTPLPSEKHPPVPIKQEAGCAPEPVWSFWKTPKKKNVPAGIRTLYYTARSLVTILSTPLTYSHFAVGIQNLPNPRKYSRKEPSRRRTT